MITTLGDAMRGLEGTDGSHLGLNLVITIVSVFDSSMLSQKLLFAP